MHVRKSVLNWDGYRITYQALLSSYRVFWKQAWKRPTSRFRVLSYRPASSNYRTQPREAH